VTLRQALGGNARRIHQLVDELLDGEDSLILLIDGRRAISFAEAFGLSQCQLELVTIEIERAMRAVGGTGRIKTRERRTGNEEVGGFSNRARVREHWVVMAAGVTAVWSTEEVRVVGLMTWLTAIVAALLVLYFDWRAKLQGRILAERDGLHDLDKAA
jgi:hypothetical protein